MLGVLRRIFRSRDALRDAGRRMAGRDFAAAIAGADIIVIGELQSDGIDPTEMTGEQLLAEVERAAKALSERTEFRLFMYERDGVLCLPFFSSTKHCDAFCGEFSKRRNRVFPFEVYTVSGDTIAGRHLDADVLVLNDGTSDARLLSAEEREALEEFDDTE